MRVGMVTWERFPPDIRIEKEADTLYKAGHQVLVFTPIKTENSVAEVSCRVFEYGRTPVPGTKFGRIRHLFKQNRVQLVHLQDTPGSFQALLAAKSLGLRVIYDIHEIWPSLVIDNSQSLTFETALWSASLTAEETLVFTGADVSLTVVDEATDYFRRKYKHSDRVYSIRNFETLQRFRDVSPSTDLKNDQGLKVTYVGGLDGPIRGIEEVILAAERLRSENIQFLIVGSGSHMRWLQLLTAKLHLENKVRFLGSKSFDAAMEVIAASDVCLVPHKSCPSTQHTLPHKISQYMALQKPVIATNLAPIVRLFDSAVIQWEPRTPEKLAELILAIREDRGRMEEIARRGYRLVSEKYRWEEEGKKLVAIYEKLSSR